jgi:hypothetical protein
MMKRFTIPRVAHCQTGELMPSPPYDAGFTQGRHEARQVLDLKYYSEMKRVGSGDMPDAGSLPLGEAGRRDWLLGYAAGIIREVTKEEVVNNEQPSRV